MVYMGRAAHSGTYLPRVQCQAVKAALSLAAELYFTLYVCMYIFMHACEWIMLVHAITKVTFSRLHVMGCPACDHKT